MNLYALPSLAAFIVELGLAAFVLRRNRRHPANVSFAAGMALLAFSSLCDYYGFYHADTASPEWMFTLSYLLEGFALVGWLVFSICYARTNYLYFLNRWKWSVMALGVGLLSVWGIGTLTGNLMILEPPVVAGRLSISLGWAGRLFEGIMLAGSVAVLFNLETTWRNAFWVTKWKIRYMLLGIGGIWVFYLYHLSRGILWLSDDATTVIGKALVTIVCSLILMAALVLQRQLDTDIFVSRYAVYHSATFVLAGLYLLVVVVASREAESLGRVGEVLAILMVFFSVLFLAALALSEKWRRRAKVLISKHFYKYKYDYRVIWLELTERLSSKFSEEEIAGEVASIIGNTLSVERITIWVFDDVAGKYRSVYSSPAGEGIELGCSRALQDALGSSDYVFNLSQHATDIQNHKVGEEDRQWFKGHSISSLVPLRSGNMLVGVLGIGRSIAAGEYDYEDYDLLKTVAKQAANSLFAIQLTRNLMKGRELETFHKMSSFLLHDLKNSVSMLKLVASNAAENMSNPDFQKDAMAAVRASVEKMNRLIEKISSFPKGLELDLREISLGGLVQQAANQVTGTFGDRMVLDIRTDESLTVTGDADNLQRVLTNLVLNAAEAMEGNGRLGISVSRRDNRAVVAVRDQGCGMTPEFIETSLFRPFHSTKKRGIGIGLYQCKFIVEAHKGWIEVDSHPGAGTEFRVVLPLARSN